MEEKNRYLFLELLFTFFLLEPVIFLFGDNLSPYRLYFTLGLIGGFSLSWFNRNKQSSLTRIFINIGAVGVFIWIIYLLLNSSLLYREAILTFIKGGIVLEVIFSFNSYYPPFLTYIQALSLPLLMCFPIFVKGYNEAHAILVLIYIICWVVILRIKFYKFLKPLKEKKVKQHLSIFISAILFLIIIFVSWLLSYRLSLGKIEKGGFLLEESRDSEIESGTLEKEYYDLQDKVQKEVSQLIPGFNSREDRYDMLFLLSSLIKESPSVMETEKAQLGLISRIKTSGPGLEKAEAEEIAIQIKSYLDKKVLFNLKNFRENITDFLKKNKYNILERISVSNLINKMQSADSNQKIKKYGRELRQIINDSSAGDNAKRDLPELAGQLKEWKTFDVYRRNSDSLNKKLDSVDKQSKKEFSDLLSSINSIERLPDFKEVEKRIEKLKETMPSAYKDMIREIEEILDLKSEMFLSGEARDLKEKIESFKLAEDESRELKEEIDDIKDAQDYQKFLKSLSEYQEKIGENRINVSAKTKELLEIKKHLLFNEKKEKIKNKLEESNLPDRGAKLLKDLEKLESEKNREKLISNSKKLKEDIEKFLNQGFISNASKDNLVKESEEIKNLFLSELEAEKEAGERETHEEKGGSDYWKDWEESIEGTSLKEERKEALRQLAKELSKAKAISQIENIKEVAGKEIENLSKDKLKQEEIKRIKETFDSILEIKRVFIVEKTIAALREKIEDLQQVNPQSAEKIQRFLEKIKNSHTSEQLRSQIDALKEYLNSKRLDQEKKPEEIKETGILDIYILPSHLVMPVGSSVSLKAVAVYNKIFIKEIGSELEWFSSEPYIAWVDEKGIVHSLAKGKTQIYANYHGQDSQEIEVTVVDKIEEQLDRAVERE